MKRVLLFFVVVLAFAWTTVAQDQSTTSSSQTTTTTTTKKSHKNAAAADSKAAADTASAKSAAKTSTITGCVSKSAGTDGSYTIANGRYKNGVAVTGSDDISKHAGHKVQLAGNWTTPGKSFEETKIKHVSETCTVAGTKSADATTDTTTTTTTKKTKKSSSATPKS